MEGKNRKERFLVCLAVFLCVIIVSLCWFESRLVIGWRPFANIGEEGLYYASFRRAFEEDITLLSEDEMDELTDLLQKVRVRSTGIWYENYRFLKTEAEWKKLFQDVYTAGWSRWSFTFEAADRKGDIIQIRTYKYLTRGENGDLDHENEKYGLLINEEYYFITENCYQMIEKFVKSLLY